MSTTTYVYFVGKKEKYQYFLDEKSTLIWSYAFILGSVLIYPSRAEP